MKTSQQIECEIKEIEKKYFSISVSTIDNTLYWLYYILLAHRGKPIFSPSLDAQYEKGFLRNQYDKYHKKIITKLKQEEKPTTINVPKYSLDELSPKVAALLMRKQIPFVISAGAKGLGILHWNLDLLDKIAGDCEVPINKARDQASSDFSKPSKSYLYYDFKRGPLSEVTAGIRRGDSYACVSASENILYHADSRLRKDIGIERWEEISGWEKRHSAGFKKNFYIGKVLSAQIVLQPGGAFTLWHMEAGDNFFVLAKGRKTWELAHPRYSAALHPRVKINTNYIGSNIDMRESDEIQAKRGFTAYANIPKMRVDLGPGDVLRVPNYWWHTAATSKQSYALAATVRAISDINFAAPGCSALRLLDPQLKAIIASLRSEGRIFDHHIGHPRKSRMQNKSEKQKKQRETEV